MIPNSSMAITVPTNRSFIRRTVISQAQPVRIPHFSPLHLKVKRDERVNSYPVPHTRVSPEEKEDIRRFRE